MTRRNGPFRPALGRWPLRLPPLVLLTAVALVAAAVLQAGRPSLTALVPLPVSAQANRAERILVQAEHVLAAERLAEGLSGDAPGGASAFIGGEYTALTTTLGSLEAKLLSTDRRWASTMVMQLHHAGLRSGDVVAAGFSGSFPALNTAVIAACEAMGLELHAVSSVTASTYGANQAGFTWPEIEERLVRAGVIRRASVAVSMGGAGDRALDLDAEGRADAERIARAVGAASGLPVLRPRDFQAAIAQRFEVYKRAAGGRPIRLYVNVGGAEASLGRSQAVLRLRNGFIRPVAFDVSPQRGMIARFAERGVPVLMLLNVRDLAVRWGIL